MIRDLIRQVQELRKQAGCRFDEQIALYLDTENREVREAIEKHFSLLQEETKSGDVSFRREAVDAEGTVNIGDASVWVGVKRQR
jgi:valyl-tRNA synthetase